MTRQTAPIISGVVAAVAAFIVWILFDNSMTSSIIFAVIAGLLAFGVSYFQYRNRA
jgi:heme/copper-type cytochrome/quinol oxidase subunit 2